MLEKFFKEFNNKGEIYLRIKVRPGASINEVVDILSDDTIKINIAAAPERGRANKELLKFLKSEFKASDIKIISGKAERVKLIKILK